MLQEVQFKRWLNAFYILIWKNYIQCTKLSDRYVKMFHKFDCIKTTDIIPEF